MVYDIYIWDQIGSDFFVGVTASSIKDEVGIAKQQGATKLVIHINSPGGSVFEGYAIYNLLKQSGFELETVVEGLCASIASLIFLAAPVRKMSAMGQLMIHNPSVGTEGDAHDHRSAAELLDQIKSQMMSVYKSRSNLDEARLIEMMDKETWMDAAKAIEYGFVTEEVPINNAQYLQIMNNAQNKKKGLLDKIQTLIKNALEQAPINGSKQMEDGTSVYFEGEQIEVGSKLYSDTEMTQAVPDAAHRIMIDDMVWIITTVGGVVESMAQDSSDPMDEIKQQLAAAQEEITNLKTQLTEKDASVTTLTNTLTEVNKQLEEMAKLELGTKFKPTMTSTMPNRQKPAPDKELFGGVVKKWVSSPRYQKQD